MSVLNGTELPNPFTPLAFLPPTLASQLEASRYLYIATLSVSTTMFSREKFSHLNAGLYMGPDYGNSRRIQNAHQWEIRSSHPGVLGISVSTLSWISTAGF